MATIAEIRTDFLLRRSEIDALDQGLAAERRAIQNHAIDEGRPMSEHEKSRRKAIGATRQELADAQEVLALATLEQLNNAEDLVSLHNEIVRINDMLQDDLEHLKTLEEYAEVAAKALEGLSKVAGKVLNIAL